MRALAASLAALLLVAGCGGGDGDDDAGPPGGPPKARESLKSVLPDYERAAVEQDCVGFARFVHTTVRPPGRDTDDRPDADECAQLAQSYVQLSGLKLDKSREYGPAAVVEGRIDGQRVALIWTLDVDRHWKQVQATPRGVPEQIGGVERPGGHEFDQHVREWVDAQRRGDCRTVFRLFNTAATFVIQDQNDPKRFCARYRRGRRIPTTLSYALSRSPGAKPVKLGETPMFAFYGLATSGGGYWTVIMSTLPALLPPGGHAEDSVLDYYPNRRAKP